jgi:60 kDa SS-A/Ro ribonucleoprotein
MIRNFVQIIRSGVVGRKSLGSRPKKLILKWLAARTPEGIFKGSVGNDPSLADILKMVHPKPDTDERRALYAYLIGKEYKAEALPKLVQEFEALKKSKEGDPPAVPFEMLTALELTEANWISIARNASWTQTRMNLNTFSRHGVFQSDEMTKLVADRLRDAEAIKKAKAFPYQLMVAFLNAAENVPKKVSEALQDAMEIAIENVPVIEGQVYVFPDVSGSMSSAITGNRPGSTSKVRCIDIAALIAAAILRKNPEAEVIPFEGDVHPIRLNPRDSVMTNATKLSRIGGGYTNCSAPLVLLNKKNAKADLLIYISDNESWVDSLYGQTHKGTETMKELRKIQNRSPKAKMVCIDIQAGDSTQAKEANDILNIGGFSDAVFDVVAKFATVGSDPTTWVDEIKKIEV